MGTRFAVPLVQLGDDQLGWLERQQNASGLSQDAPDQLLCQYFISQDS